MSSTPNRLEALFSEACALADGERERYIAELRAEDPALATRLEQLLRHDSSETSLTHAIRDAVDSVDGAIRIGEKIDGYEIVRRVATGGMGDVFEAQQERPVRRAVALKVIKPGMDSREVVARFEAERQALALMAHPAIAQVYDGGTTTRGLPYFVMEWVDGQPLTQFCNDQRFSVNDRIELFIEICEGVQHAHNKGIIHRDLKPSNILVSSIDGRELPKIIDFGIAKAISGAESGAPGITTLGQFVGTPEYMSPEQASSDFSKIDTRSDVYSLGVVLYELLTGRRPFNLSQREDSSIDELRRSIQERTPSLPSTQAGDREAAAARGLDIEALREALRGDLDWILLKALEKESDRRYQSPLELADELRRHLRDEPILAGPPDSLYKAGKFIRRHRLAVTAAALVLTSLIVAVIGTSFGMLRAQRAERRAIQEARSAERIAQFMTEIFGIADPGEARGETITAKEILDRGAEQIRAGLDEEPKVRADLMTTIGEVYRNLGLPSEARPLIDEALELRRADPGATPRDLAHGMQRAGSLLAYLDEGERAEKLLLEALAIEQQLHGPNSVELNTTLGLLANLYTGLARFDDAERMLLDAVHRSRLSETDQSSDLSSLLNELGILYDRSGRIELSEKAHRESMEILLRIEGEDHPHTLTAMTHLAGALTALDRKQEAVELHERSLEIGRRVHGEDNMNLGFTLNGLGLLYRSMERFSESEAAYVEALQIWRHELDEDHPWMLAVKNNLAQSYHDQERLDEAERLFREVVTAEEISLGVGHPETAYSINNLGMVLMDGSDLDGAERYLRQALQIRRDFDPPNLPMLAADITNVGRLLTKRGELAEAETLLREALSIATQPGGGSPTAHSNTLHALGELLIELGGTEATAEAAAILDEALEIRRKHNPDGLQAIEAIERTIDRLGR